MLENLGLDGPYSHMPEKDPVEKFLVKWNLSFSRLAGVVCAGIWVRRKYGMLMLWYNLRRWLVVRTGRKRGLRHGEIS